MNRTEKKKKKEFSSFETDCYSNEARASPLTDVRFRVLCMSRCLEELTDEREEEEEEKKLKRMRGGGMAASTWYYLC